MTLEDFQNNIETAVENTVEDLKPVMEQAALSAKALLRRRIQTSGFGKQYRSRSYQKLRARRGFEIRFVNLTFTGEMFSNWKRPGSYRQGFIVGGSVGGTDKITQNKLSWNKSRFPSFDRVNDEEKNIIVNEFLKPEIIKIFQKNLTQ